MSKRETRVDKIVELILTEQSIECDVCNETYRKYNVDEYSFAEHLLDVGWDIKKGQVICSKCKKLKI